jgi:hypothetical protein
VEELAGGAQLVRYRCWPVVRRVAWGLLGGLAALAVAAAVNGAYLAAAVAAGVAGALAVLCIAESGAAVGALLSALPAGLNLGDDGAGPASAVPSRHDDAGIRVEGASR